MASGELLGGHCNNPGERRYRLGEGIIIARRWSKCLYGGYILKVEPIRFLMDLAEGVRAGSQHRLQAFRPEQLETELPPRWMRNTV